MNIALILLFMLTALTEQAKILVVVPSPYYSHQSAYRPLWMALVERGHDITLITANPMNSEDINTLENKSTIQNTTREHFGNLGHKPGHDQYKKRGSIRQIDVSNVYDAFKKNNFYKFFLNSTSESWNQFAAFMRILNSCSVELLENPEVKTLIANTTENFDLLMLEYLNPIVLAFTYRFRAPFIGFVSVDTQYMGHDAMGDPTHPVLYPDVNVVAAHGELTFWERLESCINYLFSKIFYHFAMRDTELLARKYIGGYPFFAEKVNELDMYFMISNPLFRGIRPTVPGVLHLSGMVPMHKRKPPDPDLQSYLDGAAQGVIYLSLGTNYKSKYLPLQLKQTIMDTFAELPYEVLWKYEEAELPGRPPNVRIMKWLPQKDVLNHPNVKVFITHGGLHSIEEAIFSHVPMVGVPMFGDQGQNVNKIVVKGMGLSVDIKSLTKEVFKAAILEVAGNSKYEDNVRKFANLSLDKPMSSLEEAVWWTEYVIRHKGAKHLKGPAAHVPTYQYFLLDVIGFVTAVICLMLWVCYKLIKIISNSCWRVVIKSKQD